VSDDPAVDFAVLAYREEGRWELVSLPPRHVPDLDTLVSLMRQQPAEGGTLALVSVEEDYFVVARSRGPAVSLLLSDVTAADESPFARAVLDHLDLPLPDDEDLDQVQPAGELDLLADLGVPAMDLAALCSELDLYPDEALAEIAGRLGFGAQFEAAVDSAGR